MQNGPAQKCTNLACRYYGEQRCRCYPWIGMDWQISERTQRELAEIDANIRSATINAKNVVFD